MVPNMRKHAAILPKKCRESVFIFQFTIFFSFSAQNLKKKEKHFYLAVFTFYHDNGWKVNRTTQKQGIELDETPI